MALNLQIAGLLKMIIGILLCMIGGKSAAWGGVYNNSLEKVHLKDVKVLTLIDGKMTTGRRSSTVPQLNCVGESQAVLNCVGGSAQNKYRPQVVQCKNMGWDGQNVQWKCKSDMDNLYRFGEIKLFCEGYDYPKDPYITKGSCGLEYKLEYTLEGYDRQKNTNDYSSSYCESFHDYERYNGKTVGKWQGLIDLLVLAMIAVVVYAIYRTCFSNLEMGDIRDQNHGDHPGGGGGGGWFFQNNRNFRYGSNGNDDAACGTGHQQPFHGRGGFWTGMASGGMLGHMFGGNQERGTGEGRSGCNSRFNRDPSSSGTRTASGFGKTKRR